MSKIFGMLPVLVIGLSCNLAFAAEKTRISMNKNFPLLKSYERTPLFDDGVYVADRSEIRIETKDTCKQIGDKWTEVTKLDFVRDSYSDADVDFSFDLHCTRVDEDSAVFIPAGFITPFTSKGLQQLKQIYEGVSFEFYGQGYRFKKPVDSSVNVEIRITSGVPPTDNRLFLNRVMGNLGIRYSDAGPAFLKLMQDLKAAVDGDDRKKLVMSLAKQILPDQTEEQIVTELAPEGEDQIAVLWMPVFVLEDSVYAEKGMFYYRVYQCPGVSHCFQ